MYFTTIENSLWVYFFTKSVKLDPDPHGYAFILPPGSGSAFRKTTGSGSAKNECGSSALNQTYASALTVTGSVFDYIWDSSDNYYYKERGIVQMTNVKSDADIEL